MSNTASFIYFLRGVVLLAALIVVPGIAIGWNQLAKLELPQFQSHHHKIAETKKIAESEKPPVFQAELVLPEEEKLATPLAAQALLVTTDNPPVQQVGWQEPVVILSGQTQTLTRAANPPAALKPALFQTLEQQLKSLGAKSYKLEKWGSKGELFRFSCLVAASDVSQYEKQFQAIGADETGVMQTVIEDIKHWKDNVPAN